MNRERFEELVARAVENLPEEFQESLENVDIVVIDKPTPEQLTKQEVADGDILLGLYEGVPQTERGSYYGMVMPDKITIFQQSIESLHHDEWKIIKEIENTVKHEIAHHFGISDARLDELEEDRKH
ncbi:MAG: metallopeptidase family protein [Dehalococcoidales bacterium]|nr:metallopeptidase family protein [Dehalococcoidales bacterium]